MKSNIGRLVVVVIAVVVVITVVGAACDGNVATRTVELVDSVAIPGLVVVVLMPARSSFPHAAIAVQATTMAIAERKVMSTVSHRSGSSVSSHAEADPSLRMS